MRVSLSSLTIAGGEDSFLVFSLSSLTIAGGEDAFVRFCFSGALRVGGRRNNAGGVIARDVSAARCVWSIPRTVCEWR